MQILSVTPCAQFSGSEFVLGRSEDKVAGEAPAMAPPWTCPAWAAWVAYVVGQALQSRVGGLCALTRKIWSRKLSPVLRDFSFTP